MNVHNKLVFVQWRALPALHNVCE